jgi:transposase
MPRSRYVCPLSESTQLSLQEIYRTDPVFSCRQRAQAILLSHKGYNLNQLQAILDVDRDTLSQWINRFEASGIEGLQDLPRSGRPPIYTLDEIQQLKTLIDDEPRQIKQAKAALETATGKSSCVQTLKRVLKKT